jgi:ABC-type lipoprotein export system ATPase subunit
MVLLAFDGVSKRYRDGRREIVVLNEASFEIWAGDFVGIWGQQRSGKSTLLRIAAGIDLPDAGSVRFDGRDMAGMSFVERKRLARGEMGFVSTDRQRPRYAEQVVDVIAQPLVHDGFTPRQARRRVRRALDRVSMTSCADEYPRHLSLSEWTRVMLAEALAHEPRLLLVDEPTGMSRWEEREEFNALLRAIAREQNLTLVVASCEFHDLVNAGVLMCIDGGELRSTHEPGTVLPFPRRPATPRPPKS